MTQEVDARTQYLLQNHSLIEDSVPKEPEQKDETSVGDDQKEEVPV